MGKLHDQLKIAFFGTSEFAIPALQKLVESGFDIAAVITQSDKSAGRKQLPLPSPVKKTAQELGLKFLQLAKLDSLFHLPSIRPPHADGIGGEREGVDLFIVASYGKIIPREILEIPKYGALNIHPSLLPKYRGPSPIQAAILNGDEETGVTIIKMDEEVDHGPIVANSKFKISNSKIGYQELHDELAELGAELLVMTLPKYLAGEIKPRPQEPGQATFTKIITKADARIDWNFAAAKIESMVRAYESWPVAWTMLDGKRLKIYKTLVLTSPLSPPEGPGDGIEGEVEPGRMVIADGKLIVNTAGGQIEILELQLEGGKRMKAKDFINGYPGLQGKILV